MHDLIHNTSDFLNDLPTTQLKLMCKNSIRSLRRRSPRGHRTNKRVVKDVVDKLLYNSVSIDDLFSHGVITRDPYNDEFINHYLHNYSVYQSLFKAPIWQGENRVEKIAAVWKWSRLLKYKYYPKVIMEWDRFVKMFKGNKSAEWLASFYLAIQEITKMSKMEDFVNY